MYVVLPTKRGQLFWENSLKTVVKYTLMSYIKGLLLPLFPTKGGHFEILVQA
jgi:hypothetical protein